jgi:hypothetical protein
MVANGVAITVRGRVRASMNVSVMLGRIPKKRRVAYATLFGIAVAASVIGLIRTQGWSQNPEGFLPRCEWSLGKAHGMVNECVSYGAWVADGDRIERAFLTIVALVLLLDAFALFGMASSRPTKGEGALP